MNPGPIKQKNPFWASDSSLPFPPIEIPHFSKGFSKTDFLRWGGSGVSVLLVRLIKSEGNTSERVMQVFLFTFLQVIKQISIESNPFSFGTGDS